MFLQDTLASIYWRLILETTIWTVGELAVTRLSAASGLTEQVSVVFIPAPVGISARLYKQIFLCLTICIYIKLRNEFIFISPTVPQGSF